MGSEFENPLDSLTESVGSWWDGVVKSFQQQWWIFVIAMAGVLLAMIIIKIITKGKMFKIKTMIKVLIHCALGFVALFVLNVIGGVFTAGEWVLTPHWYSWIIIAVFGIIGVVFLLIASFIWPGVLSAV